MKKLFLLIPVGLLATTGLLWMNADYHVTPKSAEASIEKLPENSVKLFSLSEHAVRQVVRYGDEKSLSSFKASMDALDASLLKYKPLGFEIKSVQSLISQYEQDGKVLTKSAESYSQKLHTCSDFEQRKEKSFSLSLEQIGLYKLKTALMDLNQARLEYIKEPSPEAQEKYEMHLLDMKTIITELYLDSVIEEPLFAYLDNHKNYFNAISSIYQAAGFECVARLRTNGYAIKSQLQLLPQL